MLLCFVNTVSCVSAKMVWAVLGIGLQPDCCSGYMPMCFVNRATYFSVKIVWVVLGIGLQPDCLL